MENLNAINNSIDTKQKMCSRLQRHKSKANAELNTTDQSANTKSISGGDKCSLGDTIPLLARRRLIAHSHPISLSSTDITKRSTSKDRYESPKHIHTLCHPNMCNNYMQQASFNINNNLNKNDNIHYTKSTAFHLKKLTLHIR